MSKYNILFVEDDMNLGYILKEYIELHGFSVTWSHDGAEALHQCSQRNFHLAILDVMMPRMDGFQVAAAIKEKNNLPLIFLTAKSLLVDKLKGFKIGADDYIVKPVEEEELIARIHVILKRNYPEEDEVKNQSSYSIGKYIFDYHNQKLLFDNEEVALTVKEADLLKMLYKHRDGMLERKVALAKLWTTVDYFSRRNMDVFITRLRKHLSKDPDVKIVNVHGKGFMLKVRRESAK